MRRKELARHRQQRYRLRHPGRIAEQNRRYRVMKSKTTQLTSGPDAEEAAGLALQLTEGDVQ